MSVSSPLSRLNSWQVACRRSSADRVVLGSDYCLDMGLTDPVGTVERLSALSDAERDLILGTTAAKLLRLA